MEAPNYIEPLEARLEELRAKSEAVAAAHKGMIDFAGKAKQDYLQALQGYKPAAKLVDLYLKQEAATEVLFELEEALELAEKSTDTAAQELVAENRLWRELEDAGPEVVRLVEAWLSEELPSRVKLSSGDFNPDSLVAQHVEILKRGGSHGSKDELLKLARAVARGKNESR